MRTQSVCLAFSKLELAAVDELARIDGRSRADELDRLIRDALAERCMNLVLAAAGDAAEWANALIASPR